MSAELKLVPSYETMNEIVTEYIKGRSGGEAIDILEAGCGRKWEFRSLGVPYRLTGVDLDYDALEFRKTQQGDLDETIYGDLRTVPIKDKSFDIIYSSYVLEHIEGVDVVLDNFVKWLRDSGVMIVKVPDRDSLYGCVTRLTPHWFHVFVYKYILGARMAGTPGHGPYRTVYDQAISRKRMLDFAKRNNLVVKEQCGYHNHISHLFAPLSKLLYFISFGHVRSDYADMLYIFQKQANPT